MGNGLHHGAFPLQSAPWVLVVFPSILETKNTCLFLWAIGMYFYSWKKNTADRKRERKGKKRKENTHRNQKLRFKVGLFSQVRSRNVKAFSTPTKKCFEMAFCCTCLRLNFAKVIPLIMYSLIPLLQFSRVVMTEQTLEPHYLSPLPQSFSALSSDSLGPEIACSQEEKYCL